MEKISVIITTYKRNLEVLQRAVDSVLAQTYKNVELIIINDYPPIKEKINKRFERQNITVLHNEISKGACYSRNRGVEETSGEYIAFLDDDDTWMPTKLECQYSLIKKGYGMVYCLAEGIDDTGNKIELDFIEEKKECTIDDLLSKNCIGGCSFPLIQRSVLKDAGGFDDRFKSSQDHDLWIRIAEISRIALVPEVLVQYYITPVSITSNIDNRVQGYDLLLEKHKGILRKYKKSAMQLYYQYFEVFAKMGIIKYAFHYLLKSFAIFPANLLMPICGIKHIVTFIKNRM